MIGKELVSMAQWKKGVMIRIGYFFLGCICAAFFAAYTLSHILFIKEKKVKFINPLEMHFRLEESKTRFKTILLTEV